MSKIEWTDETWNPVTGCNKISDGCKHCYAETMAARLQAMGQANYANGFVLTLQPHMLSIPLTWKKPRMCFVCSMSDLFHKDVPNEYIAAVFGVMAACPSTTFQVLTKRAERLPEFFERFMSIDGIWAIESQARAHGVPLHDRQLEGLRLPLGNLWIGVSVENRKHGLPRIEHLRAVRDHAAVLFLSIEPLLEDLGDDWSLDGIDWVIVGGESGHGARPMHPAWVRRIRDKVLAARVECKACTGAGRFHDSLSVLAPAKVAGIMRAEGVRLCRVCHGRGWTGPALFFKQQGAWIPVDQPWQQESPRPLAKNERWLNVDGGHGFHGEQVWRMRNVGKGKAGRALDGRTWDEMPARAR